jgi:hypothetical protein
MGIRRRFAQAKSAVDLQSTPRVEALQTGGPRTGALVMEIPLDLERRLERRWAARFLRTSGESSASTSPRISHAGGSADAVAPAAVAVADSELIVGIGVEAHIGTHPHAHAATQLQALRACCDQSGLYPQ